MRDRVFEAISKERDVQDEMYGEKNAKLPGLDHKRLTLIGGQFGEACTTLDYIDCESDLGMRMPLIEHYKSELIQTAALLVQLLERLDKEYPS